MTSESEAQEREVCLGAGAPRSRPSELRSSSISGQWKPKHPPASFQFDLRSGAGMQQSWKPYQRHGQSAAIEQFHLQLVFRNIGVNIFHLDSFVYHLYSYSLHIESKSISLKSTSGKSNFSTSSSIEKDNDSGEIKDASISSTIFTCMWIFLFNSSTLI